MPEEPGAAYDRGVIAGAIETRLAGHDKHFETINGSLAKIAEEMHGVKLALQRLADQAIADAATRISTAEAVEKARKEAADSLENERTLRRDRAERTWSPWAKLFAVIAAVGVPVGLYLAYLALKG
jgi:hypothetical protein